ncbi:MAG: TetR/AcrR family transcriptional regulator [Rhodoferax sp.]|jgi:AcrR family transcriptional regulator|nr:TetR/AcrR family transcriptional regulator [Rhodoferax sp.]
MTPTPHPSSATQKTKPGSSKPAPLTRLKRDDWLDAAFRAAVEGGFSSVRVLSLANTLGVSRGSFYWHFADHAELVGALIDRWYQRTLATNQGEINADLGDPSVRILRILDGAIAHSVEDREHDRFEQALRNLASKDSAVAASLERVDRARLQLLHSYYLQLVHDDEAARELAALFYLAVVGSHEALNRPSASVKVSNYLKAIIAKHLVHAVSPTKP